MTSPDGINWTQQTLGGGGFEEAWQSVVWSSTVGLFVAVSHGGVVNSVMTSPDGINWTLRAALSNQWTCVTYSENEGLFVAVSDTGTGDRVMTSPDGITWTSRNSAADNNWQSICYQPPY